MKKKQTKKYKLWLILIAIPVLVCFTFLIIVHRNDVYNNQLKLKIQQIPIDKHIHHHHSNNENNETRSVFYSLTSDDRYHYEFRSDFHPPIKNGHRVMIILGGDKRSCVDMWDFSVGIRILNALHNNGYTSLVICSKRKTFDIDMPIEKNNDAIYIYLSLQKWINEEYYARFRHYPMLYIHATSRGSKLAGLLCRILPIQAQMLYIFMGKREAMLMPSTYDTDLQTRLLLDPTFANWFYFDFCYYKTAENSTDRKLCPFQNYGNYYPVPPTFFTHLQNNPDKNEQYYRYYLNDIATKSSLIGGILLSRDKTLQLDILYPIQLTLSYMQNFHIWHSKPYASQLFFEHFTNPEKYRAIEPIRRTYWCSDIDFRYYERYPNITTTSTKRKQYEYIDYIRDLRYYEDALTEEVCGDLMAAHALVSRNIDKALEWINEMDQLRRSLYLQDYLKRPLRIWMYDKALLIKSSRQYSSQQLNWISISKEFLMYSPEYFIQDYFQRLNQSEKNHNQQFQWAVNPLLADYFIIPSDIMYFYFLNQPPRLVSDQFKKLILDLRIDYFSTLLMGIRETYPYWTLANGEDQFGANHILPIPGGRNMGILAKEMQKILTNVIQIAFTGVRDDLVTSTVALSPYSYRGMNVTYRHHYDVVVPQFTPLNINRTASDDINVLAQKKNQLFYFAGALSHITTLHSARRYLSEIWSNMERKLVVNLTTEIQKRNYRIMTIIDGHIETSEYIKSIQSSIFAMCPEGYLPWSPRLYESIQIGAIPIILADNIVLPFERFIDWRSFSAKVNVSTIKNITNIVYRIDNLEKYTKEKLKNVLPYLYAFRWPYSIVTDKKTDERMFQFQNDKGNVFYYLWLELRCRRLEQWYGFTVNTKTPKSLEAQRLACTNHPTICPCHNESASLAFKEYL